MLYTIKRKIDSHNLYGRIIDKSTELTLIANETDFAFDGFVIVRIKDISSIKSGDSNKYVEKLMKKEKLWPKIPKIIRSVDLSSWQSALGTIKSDVIILENERSNDYLIGPITKLTKTFCQIRYFDGTGKWLNEEKIMYSQITICKFMDRYSTMHAKYLKWSNESLHRTIN